MTRTKSWRNGLRRRLRRRPTPTLSPSPTFLDGLTDTERQLIRRCRPHTMTSPERLIAATDAVSHVIERDVPGAIVECGVWRGGIALAMVETLNSLRAHDRDVYLYDTFTGMTTPTSVDVSPFDDESAVETHNRADEAGERAWSEVFGADVFSREDLEALLATTGYPAERIHVVEGAVEETIPKSVPTSIAVLRLDTDWYESTAHELEHLYPLLERRGVLMIDDYGHWAGARRAVDEYFSSDPAAPMLARTDYTGRLGVKP